MARAKPIPVKLSDEMISRLDKVSRDSGLNNRSSVIKFCLAKFLEYVEENEVQGLPGDFKAILDGLDARKPAKELATDTVFTKKTRKSVKRSKPTT